MCSYIRLALYESKRGTSCLELALVMPFFLLLFLQSFYFGRALMQHQELSSLTREAANITFRECIAKRLDIIQSARNISNIPGHDLQFCVDRYWQEAKVISNKVDSKSEIIISIFQCNNYSCGNCIALGKSSTLRTCSECKCEDGVTGYKSKGDKNYQSRYWDLEGKPQVEQLNGILEMRGLFVTAEVFADYSDFATNFNWIGSIADEVAIY